MPIGDLASANELLWSAYSCGDPEPIRVVGSFVDTIQRRLVQYPRNEQVRIFHQMRLYRLACRVADSKLFVFSTPCSVSHVSRAFAFVNEPCGRLK